MEDIHPGYIIVGLVVFILSTLSAFVYINHRHTFGGYGRRKRIGTKKAKKEKMKAGLQPAGDS
ncbi:hypothetical protein DUNSADRAFT_2003 [Dunaliella salina]|uniref:Uncharacterized protein n=1 Tax=Dunaliella salina TaxID=3046 RepID=A0ABQ7GWC0_DUNSA|nr:hypothetical protein DUNSADRAFT_2003 [Dunaliella salina]|eukprot:KAF5838912.1 hypothetical protein DUNSADRAFT_2003 [Dunaliella salina]